MEIKTSKGKQNFPDNQFHNTVRLFYVLANFSFTTSETIGDFYLETCYIGISSQVAKGLETEDLRKIGKIKKLSKLHRMIA